MNKNTAQIELAIKAFKDGNMIIISDDQDRENEGDIVISAKKATKEAITFMIKEASGLICVAINSKTAKRLGLRHMVQNNTEHLQTAFTVSIDAKHGITTGISANDRLKTIRMIASDNSTHDDFVRPGHMFPVIAKDGGLNQRRGHTEASVLMAELAGYKEPISVMCEIIDKNGDMVRGNQLAYFAKQYNIPLISIEMLYQYCNNLC